MVANVVDYRTTKSRGLSVEGLTVSFDGFKAVDNFSFFVDQEELRVVIGPNGAGKTTLLDAISGKTRTKIGSIKFEDRQLRGLAEQKVVREGVGRKFQTPSVYQKLTVAENLEVSYPKGRGVWGALFFKRSDEVRDRIAEVATTVYLQDKLDTQAEMLSHGQKQWLEIGMLLIANPKLMLLDEPVAGMTVRERQQTADLLKKILVGRTLIVIEHDMEFVREIAHKVTVMHQGKLLAEGNMDEVQKNEMVIKVYLGH
jgi:urea transport system ATP-binding protein